MLMERTTSQDAKTTSMDKPRIRSSGSKKRTAQINVQGIGSFAG